MIKIFSFDVFDTCITRPYIDPGDIFYDLGQRVVRSFQPNGSPANVAAMRVRAEKIARKRQIHGQDLKLSDIYEVLAELDTFDTKGIHFQSMLDMEIALEIEKAVPVLEMRRRVDYCRESGKVVFASDMYLPRSAIKAILQNHGFLTEADSLYVSNDVGINKYSTALYHYIADREGVSTSEILHVGDNLTADVRRARMASVHTHQFKGVHFNRYEQAALKVASGRDERAAIGLNRAIRLLLSTGEQGSSAEPSEQLTYSVIAPFLISYVAWVLEAARRRGTQRLYFISRDGQILYYIAQVLLGKADDIECRYIYGSRNAWFAPSIVRCDESDLYWSYLDGMEKTPVAILRRLGVDWDCVDRQLRRWSFLDSDENLTSGRLELFVQSLQAPGIRDVLLDQAAEKRRQVLAYFKQEGLLEGDNWSFVDVGWELNSQAAVRRILEESGSNILPHGFYLGVFSHHLRMQAAGNFSAYFAQRGAEIEGAHSGDWIFHNQTRILLEHVFLVADHPNVIGYRKGRKWEPVYGEFGAEPRRSRYVDSLHEHVRAYSEVVHKSGILECGLSGFISVANTMLATFLDTPRRSDVESVAWIPTNIEQSHSREYDRRLSSPLTLVDILKMVSSDLGPGVGHYTNSDHAWYSGSAAISVSFNRTIFRVVRWLRKFLSGS